jgi:hypothetical protein
MVKTRCNSEHQESSFCGERQLPGMLLKLLMRRSFIILHARQVAKPWGGNSVSNLGDSWCIGRSDIFDLFLRLFIDLIPFKYHRQFQKKLDFKNQLSTQCIELVIISEKNYVYHALKNLR